MKKLSLKWKVIRGTLGATLIITPMILVSAVACFSAPNPNKPNIIFNSKPTSETVFLNQNENLPTLSANVTTDDTNAQLAYQWYENDTNSTTNGVAITGANQPTYTISKSYTQKAGLKYFYVDVKALNKDTILNSKTSEIYTVSINQIPEISIIMQPQDQIATINQTKDLPTFSVGINNIEDTQIYYQWYSSPNDSNASGKIIDGATSSSYTIKPSDIGLSTGKKYFYVKISGTFKGIQLNPFTSNTAALVINALPKITIRTQPVNTTANFGTTVLPVFSVGVNSIEGAQLNYQWYSTRNTNDSNKIWERISGANKASYKVQQSDVNKIGSKDYYVEISGTFNNAKLEVVNSAVATLTIHPLPKITIASQPQDFETYVNQTNGLPTLSVSVNNVSGLQLKYQWYSTKDTGANARWNLIDGATGSSHKIATTDTKTVGSKYFYVKISGTFNGTKLANVNSTVATLKVKPLPIINIATQPQNLGVIVSQWYNMPSLSVFINSIPGAKLTYQWYSNAHNSNTGGTAIWRANERQYTITNSDAKKIGKKYYYVTVSGTLNGIALAPVASNVATLTIHDLPNIVITKQPQRYNLVSVNQTNGLPTLSIEVKNIDGAQFSYQWYRNDVPIRGATSSSYTIPASDAKKAGAINYYAYVYANINFVDLTSVITWLSTLTVQ